MLPHAPDLGGRTPEGTQQMLLAGLRTWRPPGPERAWQLLGVALLGLACLFSVRPTLTWAHAVRPMPTLVGTFVGLGLVVACVLLGLAIVLGVGLLASRRPRLALLLAALLFIASRAVLLVLVDAALVSDWLSYHSLARGWLRGAPAIAGVPMGYPILLGEAYRLGGISTATAEVVNFAASLTSAGLIWALVRHVAGSVAGVMAVAVLALTPSQLLFTAVRGSEIMYSALLVAIAILATVLLGRLREQGVRQWLAVAGLLGITLGLSAYIRSTSLAIAPVIALLPILDRRDRRGLTAGAAIGIGALIALAPIISLNAIHLHRLSPSTTLYAGWQLYVGANVQTGGRYNAADALRVDTEVPEYRRRSLANEYANGRFDRALLATAAERDAVAFRLFVERVRETGPALIGLLPVKFADGWSLADDGARWVLQIGRPDPDNLEYRVARVLSQAWWVALLALAAIGQLIVGRRAPSLALVVTAILVPVTATVVLLETQGRYHEYVVPILAGLAAITLARSLETLRSRGFAVLGFRPRRDGEVA